MKKAEEARAETKAALEAVKSTAKYKYAEKQAEETVEQAIKNGERETAELFDFFFKKDATKIDMLVLLALKDELEKNGYAVGIDPDIYNTFHIKW